MKVVYEHKRPQTGEVYYVGCGLEHRAYNMVSSRNHEWHQMYLLYGCDVNIVASGLSKLNGLDLEEKLIKKYGRRLEGGQLVNITKGGKDQLSGNALKTLVKRLGKRVTYKRMVFTPDTLYTKHIHVNTLRVKRKTKTQKLQEQKEKRKLRNVSEIEFTKNICRL